MPDQRLASMHGIYSAPEVAMLQRVMSRLGHDHGLEGRLQDDLELARLILRMYAKGLCIENSLYEFCLTAAKYRLKRSDSEGGDQLRWTA